MTTTTCLVCKNERKSHEPLLDLSVPIPNVKRIRSEGIDLLIFWLP